MGILATVKEENVTSNAQDAHSHKEPNFSSLIDIYLALFMRLNGHTRSHLHITLSQVFESRARM